MKTRWMNERTRDNINLFCRLDDLLRSAKYLNCFYDDDRAIKMNDIINALEIAIRRLIDGADEEHFDECEHSTDDKQALKDIYRELAGERYK